MNGDALLDTVPSPDADSNAGGPKAHTNPEEDVVTELTPAVQENSKGKGKGKGTTTETSKPTKKALRNQRRRSSALGSSIRNARNSLPEHLVRRNLVN